MLCVSSPIQDDINVYIGYTLMMSKVVKKVIDSANAQKQNICPFQLDLVICGRRQKQQDGGDDNKEDDESDDDDDDDVNLAARLNVGLGGSFAPMVNEIPADGVCDLTAFTFHLSFQSIISALYIIPRSPRCSKQAKWNLMRNLHHWTMRRVLSEHSMRCWRRN